jgi:hypothetical protein
MAYRWFTVPTSARLGQRPEADDEAWIVNWRAWSIGFIADVIIEGEKQYCVRVNAFPLLYEFLNASVYMCANRSFDVEIGEGLWLRGAVSEGGIEIAISFEAGGRNDVLLQRNISASDTILFLALKTAEVASSLEKIGVDLEHYLSKFPVGVYRRGIA